jgi:hypothetical protein
MDGVYSCCDRTDSGGISDIVAVELQKLHRPTVDLILGPVFDNEKENCRISNTKEIYAIIKKPNLIETIRLNRFRWFGHV